MNYEIQMKFIVKFFVYHRTYKTENCLENNAQFKPVPIWMFLFIMKDTRRQFLRHKVLGQHIAVLCRKVQDQHTAVLLRKVHPKCTGTQKAY